MAATNILNLPLVGVKIVTGTEEDWLDALAWLDANGAPVSLAGISFGSVLKERATDATGYALASTEAVWGGLPRAGTLSVGGQGNSVLAWTVPASVMRKVPPKSYVLDVVATVQGRRVRVVQGTVKVIQGITR